MAVMLVIGRGALHRTRQAESGPQSPKKRKPDGDVLDVAPEDGAVVQ